MLSLRHVAYYYRTRRERSRLQPIMNTVKDKKGKTRVYAQKLNSKTQKYLSVNKITRKQLAKRRSNDRWDSRHTWNNRRLPSRRTSTWRKTDSEQLHRYRNLLQFAFLDVTPAHMHQSTVTAVFSWAPAGIGEKGVPALAPVTLLYE